jgi:hypothetical protein
MFRDAVGLDDWGWAVGGPVIWYMGQCITAKEV